MGPVVAQMRARVLQCDAVHILLPLMSWNQLMYPGRGDSKLSQGEDRFQIPFASLTVQETGSPSARPTLVSLILASLKF